MRRRRARLRIPSCNDSAPPTRASGGRRPWAAWLPLVCLTAAGGGGKRGPRGRGGGGGDAAGDYLLVGANDDALPAVVTSNGCSAIQVVNGGLTLSADGQFQMQFNWQDVNGEAQFSGDHGRYRQEGDGLVFGNEGSGAPAWLHDEIGKSQRVTIPHANAELRSLNLSTAAGIACYEALRQVVLPT